MPSVACIVAGTPPGLASLNLELGDGSRHSV